MQISRRAIGQLHIFGTLLSLFFCASIQAQQLTGTDSSVLDFASGLSPASDDVVLLSTAPSLATVNPVHASAPGISITSTPTLTGGPSAAAAAITSAASAALSPAVASNAIELDVDPATGHLFLNGNNALQVSSVVFNSASGALVGNDSSRFTGAFTALFPNNASDSATLINQFNSATAGATVNGSLDAGALFALARPTT